MSVFDVLQVFSSLQAKQCAIISYKLGKYKLPQKLLNNLRLRILEN